MAVFSDVDILDAIKSGRIKVTPFTPEAVQPGSLELTLGNEFLVFRYARIPIIDTKAGKPLADLTEKIVVKDNQAFYLLPGELVLASTKESLELAADICGSLEGRSSFARMGLVVHATSSYLHPGSRGKQTLEMSNVTSLPIIIYPGQRVCQIVFQTTISPAKTPYFKKKGAKYVDQKGPESSKLYLE